ncbi:MAG: putative O-glycosylation ligase, exosortase A system-associated [Gammaproteobacteria bacterium]|nr:putative O-glycosylation ligase, exosortase A system-associated [Gammaproteobacteria bacterium]
MRDLIITLVIIGAVPFILMRPYIGVYVWSWLSYMNPHRFSWGFAYNMPFSAITAGALITGFLLTKDKNKFIVTPITIVWIAFFLWITLSTFTAINVEVSMVEWRRVVKIQLITLFTLLLITSRERLNQLIWVIVLSIGFFGIKGGLFVAATGGSFRVGGPPDSFVSGNNEIALALLMVLPLMWYLRTQSINKWIKHALLVSILLCVLSIISTYSRGAFVASAAVMMMFWMKSNKKLLIGTVLVALAITVLSFMPSHYFERINTIQTYEQDASAMGRINAWHFAVNLAADHPLTGGGFGSFTKLLFLTYAPSPLDFHDAHSIYFEVLGEQGFVGLFLFLTLWVLCYRTCGNIRKQVRDIENMKWAEALASMVQVSLVAYGVGGAFLGLAYFDLPYHIMVICVLCQFFVNRELESRVSKEQGVVNIERPLV